MSLPRYTGYKDSGIDWLGNIPSHWQVQKLKYECTVFPSNVDKHSRDGETAVLLCNYTDVYYNERVTSSMSFMEATASDGQIAKFTLKSGDTIITKDSESADDIAIAAYVPEDLPGVVCGYHLSMIRPRHGNVGAFVKRLFDSVYAKAKFEVAANGLTRVGLGQYAIDNVELPFPPIVEQTAIANFLDHETAKIDALIAEQEKLIALLAEKRQATISHAVTRGLNPDVPMKASGVDWLGEIPEHWQLIRLKFVVQSIEQGWSPQCENFPVESQDEWGVLKVGCVNGGVFQPSENKKLPPELEPRPAYVLKKGDLLISRANTRELVGGAAVVPSDFDNLMLCDKLYRLRLIESKCSPVFIAAYLGTAEARSQIELAATGASSSMLNIGQSVIMDMLVPLPEVNEQRVIVELIVRESARLDALMNDSKQVVELLRERRSALISAVVTGQIDVRGLVTSTATI
ncbi:restriction endonuclease subunit S [Paenalcaligenes hominis]|uniref:restriction endonuclease subunit S n=1 Tax=Paenalcaligenes hominis TaxID=643674 RepID=UPI0035233786